MMAYIQVILVTLFVILSSVSSQYQYPEGVTCYTIYESEETRVEQLNAVLKLNYHHTETTQYQTPENEQCKNVGCVCFSYLAVCRGASVGPNHVSRCTDADRRDATLKWHRGWTTIAKCEEMRQQPSTYRNLTCCDTPRCNDQPGKIVDIVNVLKPVSLNEIFGYQNQPHRYDSDGNALPNRYDSYGHPSPQPMVYPYKPEQHHHGNNDHNPRPRPQPQHDTYGQHRHYQPSSTTYTTTTEATTPRPRHSSRTRFSSTTHFSDTYKPSEAYDKSLSSNTSSIFSCLTNWMIVFLLISYLF